MTLFRKLSASRGGATAIEYSLVAGLIAMAVIGALSQLGGQSNGMLSEVYEDVQNAMSGER